MDWASGVSPKPDPKTISKHVQRMVDVSTAVFAQMKSKALPGLVLCVGRGEHSGRNTKVRNLKLVPMWAQGTSYFSYCGCRTVQKLHFANTLRPLLGGGVPLIGLARDNIFKGCQLIWGQREVGKDLSVSKGDENLKLKSVTLLDSIHCAKCWGGVHTFIFLHLSCGPFQCNKKRTSQQVTEQLVED